MRRVQTILVRIVGSSILVMPITDPPMIITAPMVIPIRLCIVAATSFDRIRRGLRSTGYDSESFLVSSPYSFKTLVPML